MFLKTLVRTGEYHDSVALMLLARDLSARAQVLDVSVVMGTEANKALLEQAGLLTLEAQAAGANDLVVAVKAETEAAGAEALEAAAGLLRHKGATSAAGGGASRPKSVRAAVRAAPEANLAVVSVAGRYATAQAWDALRAGLHVLLFSDHVSVEDEIALKRYAVEHGLLLMGPGAGTALINGVGLGFANAVPAGPVGIVAAAGTGLQEVSSLLARGGLGVTQAIGTGGRDVSRAVGALMMKASLEALQQDDATQVIVIISKLPDDAVAAEVVAQAARGHKPTVLALMGPDLERRIPGIALQASTLEEAAAWAAALARGEDISAVSARLQAEDDALRAQAMVLRAGLAAGQRYCRGLYSGGTLCEETMRLWQARLGGVWSNAPLRSEWQLEDSRYSRAHTAVDLGEEEFTQGRPHPMIDLSLRLRRLEQEAADPQVAVVVLDVVLGFGVHLDPAAELAPAIARVKAQAAAAGRRLVVLAPVTGTDGDPQGYSRQVASLEAAGAVVPRSNAAAARLAAHLVAGLA